MFWFLLTAVVLLSLVALAAALLALWRRVKVLGSSVSVAGETLAEVGAAVEQVTSARAGEACPTCGHVASRTASAAPAFAPRSA